MVLLFSKEKIDGEIRNLIDRLVYLPDSNHFYRQLCDELGDKLTPPELKTANAGNRIKLNSFSSKGSILPAVISIHGQ